MKQNELMCADWDYNNLIPEWDWLFDYGEYTECKNQVVGFIMNHPCVMSYSKNLVIIKSVWKADGYFYDVRNEINNKCAQLAKDNEGLICDVKVSPCERKVYIHTYFKEQ